MNSRSPTRDRREKIKPVYATKVAIKRAAEAARELGIRLETLELTPTGGIRLGTSSAPISDEFERLESQGLI